jgi:N-acetyl sugar amidotransferase
MKKCNKCLLPETYETIEFDEKLSCNICDSVISAKKKINWNDRFFQLKNIVKKYKSKYDYDCIVPFSGGKDSTYQLLYVIKELSLKPLVIRFNHGFLREKTIQNTDRTLKKLGADFLEFTPNWKIVKNLMLESFKRKTDFCWHCHTGIYSYPMRMAVKLKIPLLIWGEPLAEMSAYYSYDEIEEEDETKFDKVRNLGISAKDMYGMLKGSGCNLEERDLIPYTFPDKEEIKLHKIKSINLGNYIEWDYNKQTSTIKKELGWETDELEGVPDEANPYSSKIECFMQGTRDYIKYIKRGYGRISQNMASELRNGNIKKDEAEEFIKFEGARPPSLDIFLDYLGLNEDEFNKICKSMSIPPYEHNFKSNKHANKTKDFNKWYKEKK